MTKKIAGVLIAGAFIAGWLAMPASAAPNKFPSCAQLTAKYPNGIANSSMMAEATGAKFSVKLYAKNKKLDKDKDGVACWGAKD